MVPTRVHAIIARNARSLYLFSEGFGIIFISCSSQKAKQKPLEPLRGRSDFISFIFSFPNEETTQSDLPSGQPAPQRLDWGWVFSPPDSQPAGLSQEPIRPSLGGGTCRGALCNQ